MNRINYNLFTSSNKQRLFSTCNIIHFTIYSRPRWNEQYFRYFGENLDHIRVKEIRFFVNYLFCTQQRLIHVFWTHRATTALLLPIYSNVFRLFLFWFLKTHQFYDANTVIIRYYNDLYLQFYTFSAVYTNTCSSEYLPACVIILQCNWFGSYFTWSKIIRIIRPSVERRMAIFE